MRRRLACGTLGPGPAAPQKCLAAVKEGPAGRFQPARRGQAGEPLAQLLLQLLLLGRRHGHANVLLVLGLARSDERAELSARRGLAASRLAFRVLGAVRPEARAERRAILEPRYVRSGLIRAFQFFATAPA